MKNFKFLIQLVLLLFLLVGCAKMGSMSGGYKDEVPPKLLSSKPANYAVNFNSQKIELVFDEYIALKNVNQELIISPPLPKKPDVRIKNKSIFIDLKNELRENTTYTLNFGKAIADNNEGNPLTNFEFVFSTGSFLDSLSVKGTIIDAFSLKPSKDPFIIGLYDQTEDSIPLKTIPVYVGKTDDKGLFQINNIKSDTFRIFALKDLNFNLIFDLPNEEIAFVDTFLILTPEFLSSLPLIIPVKDTSAIDTLQDYSLEQDTRGGRKSEGKTAEKKAADLGVQDTIPADSIHIEPKLPALFVDMLSFTEEGTKQYMTNKERLTRESFQLSFSLPLKYEPIINILDYEESEGWYLPEINAKRDTFTYWITDTTIISSDTIRIEVAYPKTDSAGLVYTALDTLNFISRKPSEKSGKVKEDDKKPEIKLKVTTLRNNGLLDFNANLPFGFDYPIKEVDSSLLKLYAKIDTIEMFQNYEIVYDSISLRKILLKSNWKEKTRYRIEAVPGAFTDLYGHRNDTLRFGFGLQEKSYYATIILTLSDVNIPVLIELMNEKEQVLRSKVTNSDGSMVFELLPPAKYKIRFIYDLNENKKWDSGNYLKRIQPEKVLYYVGEINVRSNWDLEVKQSLKP